MPKIYIAGPLFSEGEKKYNKSLNNYLKRLGFDTFFPQEDGETLAGLLDEGKSESEAITTIYNLDIGEIQRSDIVVLIMDGRVIDEGACVEIGYASAIGKECIGIKTDPRALISGVDNPLILGTLKNRVAKDFKELGSFLYQIKQD
jgi:nucleoside 2-deoxyribosyltransferase